MEVPTDAAYTFSLAGLVKSFETAEDLKAHVEPLLQMEKCHLIQLSGNTFGVEGCRALADVLSKRTDLIVGDFSDIFTRRLRAEIPTSLTFFTESLLLQTKLEKIDFSDNAFGPDGIAPLVPLIAKHPTLKHLRLNNNGLGPGGGLMLASALTEAAENAKASGSSGRLESLICGRNRLETSAAALGRALGLHPQLKWLQLPQDGIRPESMKALLLELRHCQNLAYLDLQDNTFTDPASLVFAEILPQLTALKTLNLGDCMLGAKGSIAILKALALQPKESLAALEQLSLQFAEMDAAGASQLAALLPSLTSLKTLEINGNCFSSSSDEVEAIKAAITDKLQKDVEDVLDELDEMESDSEDEDDEDKSQHSADGPDSDDAQASADEEEKETLKEILSQPSAALAGAATGPTLESIELDKRTSQILAENLAKIAEMGKKKE